MLAPYPPGGDPLRDGRPDLGAHVLNNSWGCPPIEGCDAQALLNAVRALRAAGVFVVASAGNEGEDCGSVSDPIAIYDEVFSIGAVDEFGQVATFSSRGPVLVDGSGRTKPDIVAPGVNILSAAPGGSYRLGSGTSDAGPHITGVVALMWSANPALIGDIERTEQILAETARPYDETMNGPLPCSDDGTPNNTVGHGLLDALAAVQMTNNR
jgi:subtilisin family serine protease